LKVSVIIPTYNFGNYIEESIDSVLRQTRLPDEIIVIDDGSTDNTSDILRKFTNERIMIIKTVNCGVSAARNTGLDHATGDVIAFLDADDRWLPHMLEKQLQLIQTAPDIVCVFCNFIRFNNSDNEKLSDQFRYYPELADIPTENVRAGSGKLILEDAFTHLSKMIEIPAFTPVMLFRKNMIKDIYFNKNLSCCEDTNFALKVFLRGKVAFNEDILAEIRRHEDNATKNIDIIIKAKLLALQDFAQNVNGLTKQQKRTIDERILKAYASYSYFLVNQCVLLSWLNHFESFTVSNMYRKKITVTANLFIKTIKVGLIRFKNMAFKKEIIRFFAYLKNK